MKPKNGVKLKSNRAEVGSGRFVNTNPSKISLADYNDIATKNQSLANISMRGNIYSS